MGAGKVVDQERGTQPKFMNLPIASSSFSFSALSLFICYWKRQIKNRLDTSFNSKDQLLQKVNHLPQGVEWKCTGLNVKGDLKGQDGVEMSELLELWHRDPVECVRELIGNPAFRDSMQFAPERLYEDELGKQEVWNEMWTGQWWWETQVSPSNAIMCFLSC